VLQGPVKTKPEPSRPQGHWDLALESIASASRSNREAGKARVNGARKVSKLIIAHFEKLASQEDKERKLEEQRMLRIAKESMKKVQNQWKDAIRVRLDFQLTLVASCLSVLFFLVRSSEKICRSQSRTSSSREGASRCYHRAFRPGPPSSTYVGSPRIPFNVVRFLFSRFRHAI
jgi:hypothetical protein